MNDYKTVGVKEVSKIGIKLNSMSPYTEVDTATLEEETLGVLSYCDVCIEIIIVL